MPFLVGFIIQAVLWLFKSRIGFLITQIMVWLGVTYASSTLVLTPTVNAIKGYATGISGADTFGSAAVQWLAVLKFDVALSMLFGAYAAKHAIAGARMFLSKRV